MQAPYGIQSGLGVESFVFLTISQKRSKSRSHSMSGKRPAHLPKKERAIAMSTSFTENTNCQCDVEALAASTSSLISDPSAVRTLERVEDRCLPVQRCKIRSARELRRPCWYSGRSLVLCVVSKCSCASADAMSATKSWNARNCTGFTGNFAVDPSTSPSLGHASAAD